ncbi:MAG: M48 family metallopeptidase [Elusimicrobiota bacterium]|jgi:predicted metal-dependent hydrolase|nr:M48 family metallopeptidase [Elusimicrobiota bacterium]
MAEIDIETTISDVKLFIEKLKSDLPEVFTAPAGVQEGSAAAQAASNGKTLYIGDLLETDVILNPAAQNSSAALENGRLIITIKDETADASALAEGWLRAQAGEILPPKIQEWAQKLNVQYNNITIKDQKTMWASCSQKNNLNFSYRIIKMPGIIIDYLIVHELSHLIHFNHGAEYWATVAQYCPAYKEHRKWLNNNKYAVMADSAVKYSPPAAAPQTEAAAPAPQEPPPENA